MEAPVKIYLDLHPFTGEFDDDWYKNPVSEVSVEYTRTDAFIEKADKWLSLNLKILMNVLDVKYDTHVEIKDFIEDFKMYMKGVIR